MNGTFTERGQKTLAVNIPFRGSQGPLHLLIDSTGIKVEREGEWNARKHSGAKRRVWRKVHLGIDEHTLEIRVVEVTSSDVGDAPMLPELLAQIPADQDIASVTAPSRGFQTSRCRATDGAYDTRKCHDAIHCPAVVCMQTTRGADRGAAAIIPPRKSAKPWKTVTEGAVARNEALRASKYLGRALWRPLSAASFGRACRAMDGADTAAEAASKQRCTV